MNTTIISDDVQTSVHCLKTVEDIKTFLQNWLVSHKHHHPHHPWDYFQWPQQGLVGRRSISIANLSTMFTKEVYNIYGHIHVLVRSEMHVFIYHVW